MSFGTLMALTMSQIVLTWIQLIIAFFCGRFIQYLPRAIFSSYRLVGWTSVLHTAWCNISQIFLGFTFGKYASQGKNLNLLIFQEFQDSSFSVSKSIFMYKQKYFN